ncbi:hypothetical protein [Chitinophaga sp. Cy-1792]|uniref:hypothetical protein n=1 Tax=Chitinophaga sp. Cy-1792 TaxID=2608339 RepID=UPI00142225D6|nr:hypothetical protein [Chitinophaga sp. Cy-1792]NIG56004.1 hypothetical protein [Chitinophaga sp. Cy-1792]
MTRYLYLTILWCFCCFTGFAQTALEKQIQRANQIIQTRRAGNLLSNTGLYDQLKNEGVDFKLPVGIGQSGNGTPPVIIDSIRFLPDHAEITAYIVVPLPGTTRELMFAGRGIPVSREGGLVGTARLELVNDQPLDLFGNNTEFTFLHGKTFVEFDCNGFKRLGLGASVNLSKKLVPVDDKGKVLDSQRVKATFEATATDLNDILAAVNIQPFQVRGAKGVTFTIQDAIIDLSDAHNSPDMVFPAEYTSDDKELWRGFFLRRFEVKLPPEIRKRSTKKSPVIAVRNALIDDKGFSGDITATNLIPMKDGDMGGWSFSLETFGLHFVANQVKGGEFGGGVNVPITGDTTRFDYSAVFHPGDDYLLTVKPTDTVDLPVLIGTAHLLKSSSLEVAVKDGNFQAKATLNGVLTIDGGKYPAVASLAQKFNVPDISFEQLTVSTEAPYFHSGTFSFASDLTFPSIAGYGLSINNIKLVKDGDKRGLSFEVGINVSGKGENGFSADATMALMGRVDKDEDGRIHHIFSELKVSKVAIDINQGLFKLKGGLEFFTDEPVYGNGFRGDINASIQICKAEVKLSSVALFGNVKGDRYWYADIMVDLPVAVPIFPPAVKIKGFGGALFYGVSVLAKGQDTTAYRLGNTHTGVIYKPDATAGLGIKASLKFIALKDKTINGMVALEIAFNRGGGLKRITFRGQVNVMALKLPEGTEALLKQYQNMMPVNKSADGPAGDCGYDPNNFKPEGLISAGLLVDVDFENSSLLANLKVYVNVYGALTGIGQNNLAGEGEFYVGPDGWHLLAGTPDNPIGVNILGLAKAHAYFMVGTGLPGSPPPPPIVSEILGGKDLDYMRDLNALGDGAGFAFGAGLDFDTGDKQFWMFYARLRAGIGFDIMVKDYGDGFHCEGKTGPIGINGWYANGQIYGYFQGKIGIKVKLPFKKGNFDIIEVGAAVVLQAKLPNPAWMRGIVGGQFKLFGGLISGNCRFELTLGEECKIVNNNIFAESGVQIIGDATPKEGDDEQSIFTAPQIVFNMPVGKVFSLDDDGGKSHQFRTRLEYMNLRKGVENIAGSFDWSGDNTVVILNTDACLEPRSAYKLTARVTFEENVNGSWIPYMVDGKVYAEELNNNFTTGNLPDEIPQNKIRYTYPIKNQLNYYRNEAPGRSGYIQLTQDLAPMFRPDSSFTQTARLIPFDGSANIDFPFTYSPGKIAFNLPEAMNNNTAYTFALVNVPTEDESDISRNVQSNATNISSGDAGNMSVTTKTATRSLVVGSEKAFYQLDFRTSKYNTFSEKLDKMPSPTPYRTVISNGVYELGYQYVSDELFDNNEVDADGNSHVLQMEALLDDNVWYKENIYPMIYNGYPLQPSGTGATPLTITWRRPETLGIPPVRAVYIRQVSTGLNLTPGGQTQYTGVSGFVYNLPYVIDRDYSELRNRMANDIYGRLWEYPAGKDVLLLTPYAQLRKGDYKIQIKYVLPGTNVITSTRIITIQNPYGL